MKEPSSKLLHAHLSTIHGEGFTPSLFIGNAECQARSCKYELLYLWFDPNENRIRVCCLTSRFIEVFD